MEESRRRGWGYERIGRALGVDGETIRRKLSTSTNAEVETQGADGKVRPGSYPSPEELTERRAKVRRLRNEGKTFEEISSAAKARVPE